MLRSLSLALSIVASLVGCSTPGAFFGAPDGPAFVAHPSADASHATVYLYRPRSQWADEELEAPGIFLNNELIGSLPSNGYLAFEFEIGSYKLEMRRPLAGSFWTLFADGPMDFTRIASFMLDARAGAVYYLRYDELNPPPKSEHPAGEGDGPLQLVAADLGAAEIGATHQVQEPMQFAASGYRKRVQRSFWEGVGRALDKIGI
ncbi:DUF2846 domain-containing protein [Pseudomonas aeruginosa]|uniref:DUF2846 domain-containing protein n=1 Tax=Pseudomonas aeruginosa TaxID=287 RepID=UPI002F3E58D3